MKHIIMMAAICCITLGWAGQTAGYLTAMDSQTRANALLDLECRNEQALEAVTLWNAGNYDEAIGLISAVEEEIGNIAVSISWRTPIKTPQGRWGTDLLINGAGKDANFIELILGDTGNLFCIAKGDSGSTHWFWAYMSTDDGATWAQTYEWGNVSTPIIDVDAGEMPGYVYIIYAGTDGVAGDTMVRIRRLNSTTGAVDGTFSYHMVLDAASNLVDIAYEPNRYSWTQFYVTAIDEGHILYYSYSSDGISWTPATTPVTNADHGLDMDYGFINAGQTRMSYTCYISTADSVCLMSRGGGAFQQYVNRSATVSGTWVKPSVAMHGDTTIVWFLLPNYMGYYHITYNGGTNWYAGSVDTDSAGSVCVTSHDNTGFRLAYTKYHASAPEVMNYAWRTYSGGWSAVVPTSEHDVWVNAQPAIEYLGTAGLYGIAYIDDNLDIYFDRIDWTGDVAEHKDQAVAPFFVKLAPNPARGQTMLSYTLGQAGQVQVALYDASGRLVDEIVNQTMSAGTHSIPISSGSLTAGVYFVKVNTPDGVTTTKLTLIR